MSHRLKKEILAKTFNPVAIARFADLQLASAKRAITVYLGSGFIETSVQHLFPYSYCCHQAFLPRFPFLSHYLPATSKALSNYFDSLWLC